MDSGRPISFSGRLNPPASDGFNKTSCDKLINASSGYLFIICIKITTCNDHVGIFSVLRHAYHVLFILHYFFSTNWCDEETELKKRKRFK